MEIIGEGEEERQGICDCAKMGFSSLFVAVTVTWERNQRMMPSPADGDGIMAMHGGR